jgi:hypothetical protein
VIRAVPVLPALPGQKVIRALPVLLALVLLAQPAPMVTMAPVFWG